MKKILLTVIAAALSLSLSAQSQKHIDWAFSSKRTIQYTEDGVYNASNGKGKIEFVGKKATPAIGVTKYYPAAEGTRKGDYWLMSIPVENIEAGTTIDVWFPFLAEPSKTPHAFAWEYLDGKEWKPVTPANKNGVNCYSTTSEKWPRFLWNTIKLEKGIKKGNLQIRLRHCDKEVTKSSLHGTSSGNSPKIAIYDNSTPSKTARILFIGNSYTYNNEYPMLLKELAWYEGYLIEGVTYQHGGYTIKQHLADNVSCETVKLGDYDYVFLQDQSLNSLRIGTSFDDNVVGEMGKMVANVKKYSPNAKCFIEMTWGRKNGNDATKRKKLQAFVQAYPEFFASYEAMQKVITTNTTAMAQELGVGLSSVGVAWEIVRRERPDIELYKKDGTHPSYAGSYLAAAVGYLTLFNEPFKADTPICLNPEVAKYLRSVAERVVLKTEK